MNNISKQTGKPKYKTIKPSKRVSGPESSWKMYLKVNKVNYITADKQDRCFQSLKNLYKPDKKIKVMSIALQGQNDHLR